MFLMFSSGEFTFEIQRLYKKVIINSKQFDILKLLLAEGILLS